MKKVRLNVEEPKLLEELALRLITKERLFEKSFSWANILYDVTNGGFLAKRYRYSYEPAAYGFAGIQYGD
jgi:hypothetical protein